MKLVVLLLAILGLVQSADYYYGFVRFHKTEAGQGTVGYIKLTQAGASSTAFTADLYLTGLGASMTYSVFVHQWGDMSSVDATAHGGCFVPNHIFQITTDASGAASTMGVAIATGVDLSGANSILGRGLTIRATQSCTGAVVAQGVVGYGSVPIVSDNNLANVAMGTNPVSAYAKIFVNGNPGNTAYASLSGDVFFTPLPAGSGRVGLTGAPATVIAYARITGIAGNHGIHAHVSADTSNFVNLTSTNLHFNPNVVVHGYPDNTVRHVGDMGNFTGDANTMIATLDYNLDLMAIGGANNIIGRCIIIHAAADNGADPVGNAGGRWGYGVIGLSNRRAPNNNLGAASHTAGGSALAIIVAVVMLAFRALQ